MPNKFILKCLGLYTKIRHANVPVIYRYFYRDTYYCQLNQLRYIIKDYIIKKPYKEIETQGEFGQELIFVLPFAYWHYKNGTLKSTTSSNYTKEIYFFSPDHREKFTVRSNEGNYNFEMPRILHSQNYDIGKWERVPLKETYKNDIYVYEKPILIIANRYNMEWDGQPVSFFSIQLLDYMIGKLKDHFTIIYNRPQAANITNDNSDIFSLEEFDWLAQEHPEVILLDDLYKENKANATSFNHLQLMVYANCDHFISTHGGTGTLASYFGGINLLLSKQGGEHFFGDFDTVFPMLSGARILLARNDEEVIGHIERTFVPLTQQFD
ncbi:hypothetical protein [Hufsiella ginkgonis]|uniref:Glycosyltransferase family 9 protein n=1 Tax=Hufsiella ginkgonis TaxID=2695274 RepID=A0A7K1XYY4_9SPHI|nr:hypothetical protein [Hufsiella ginkgonis]MXV16170.1 hypothetical protein [Hufsiella ginkgonis]